MYKNVQGYTINGNKNESENEKYIILYINI